MKNKISKGDIGHCPNIACHKQALIPFGHNQSLKSATVLDDHADDRDKTYVLCALCKGLFIPDYAKHHLINGAHFGPNFAGILLVSYPKIVSTP